MTDLPRIDVSLLEKKDGACWFTTKRITPTSTRTVIRIRCPECGALGGIGEHAVAGDGVVQPSVKCDCGWHVRVRLLDWPVTWMKLARSEYVMRRR